MLKNIFILFVVVLVLSGCGNQPAPPLNLPDEEMKVPEPELEPLSKINSGDLYGEWKTDCLVPDPKSDWAERHSFVFYMNGQATHVREEWYASGCAGTGITKTNVYNFKVPEPGKIDLESASGEGTIYDIFVVAMDNTLRFGHGFRNKQPYDMVYGDSLANRITTLNSYIVYKKQG